MLIMKERPILPYLRLLDNNPSLNFSILSFTISVNDATFHDG
jgi:hypothetical protein